MGEVGARIVEAAQEDSDKVPSGESYLILWCPTGPAQGYHWAQLKTKEEAEIKLSEMSHDEFSTNIVFKGKRLICVRHTKIGIIEGRLRKWKDG
jgi:hypothetical protein